MELIKAIKNVFSKPNTRPNYKKRPVRIPELESDSEFILEYTSFGLLQNRITPAGEKKLCFVKELTGATYALSEKFGSTLP